jgi:small subunit ribosomal protein S6e
VVKFKIVISNPEDGKAKSLEVEGANAQTLIGRTINEIIDGSIFDLKGESLLITGGVDKDGVPMRTDVHGGGKKRVILSSGIGFKSKREGERRRKMVRGRTITEDTNVINVKIVKKEIRKKNLKADNIEGKSTE